MDSERTRHKSVWLVNLFFGPGAAPTGVLLASLADELLRHDLQVEVLTGTAEYRTDFAQGEAPFSGRIHRFSCAGGGSGLRGKLRVWLKFYLKVAWFILWRRLPDIVIVQTTPPFLHTLFALRSVCSWRRPRIILWNQDTYPESLVGTGLLLETAPVYRLLQAIARWSARRIAHAVVLDQAMADRLGRQGVPQITVIPNWDQAPPPVDPEGLPAELRRLAAGFRLRIAYTGNLGRGHDLTPVWDYLRQNPDQTDFCFLFIGEGERTAELKDLAQQEGWSSVKFWSYLPAAEFSALLHWADFGLVALDPACLGLMSPSKMHAWLGAGKPVIYIGPEGSNVSETIRLFDCGVVVDPSVPGSFREVSVKLSSVQAVDGLRQQSRLAWETRHSPAVGLQSWWELLRQYET